jgi:5-methylcytosine-specific restriction endonuclease McrA
MTKPEKKVLNELLHQILALRDKHCLRCGTTQKLQMSHIYPKGRYRKLEFDPDNVKYLCYNCHLNFWHKNPIEANAWLLTAIPEKRLQRLKLRSQTSGDGMRNYKLLKIILEQEIKIYADRNPNI